MIVRPSSTERIHALALDESLDPVTGKTDLLISIWRVSDGFYLDFNDSTFKAAGWTTRQTPMTEFDATNAPGEYYYDFSVPAGDEVYIARVDQSPGTDVANLPQLGELRAVTYYVVGIEKNTDLDAFEFLMVDPGENYLTGLTVTAQRSIDGAAFAGCANAVTEVGLGIYKIDLAASDLNGNVITLLFSATGARNRYITIVTNEAIAA